MRDLFYFSRAFGPLHQKLSVNFASRPRNRRMKVQIGQFRFPDQKMVVEADILRVAE